MGKVILNLIHSFCSLHSFETKYGSTCGNYCSSIGSTCVGAWEDDNDSCTVQGPRQCEEVNAGTSDAICQCADDGNTDKLGDANKALTTATAALAGCQAANGEPDTCKTEELVVSVAKQRVKDQEDLLAEEDRIRAAGLVASAEAAVEAASNQLAECRAKAKAMAPSAANKELVADTQCATFGAAADLAAKEFLASKATATTAGGGATQTAVENAFGVSTMVSPI